MKEKIKWLFNQIKKYRVFIIFAIILFSVNTYAWFVYVTRVDTSFTATVRSWNVMFQVHDNNISTQVNFNVGDIYPGMPNYRDFASIVNTGDTAGEIYFEIKEVTILGTRYTNENYTSAQLLNMLNNNYPFTINLSLTNNVVSPGHTELFDLTVTWPYESGNDALDTEWGIRAYNYKNSTSSDTCISILAEVRVNQESIQSNS